MLGVNEISFIQLFIATKLKFPIIFFQATILGSHTVLKMTPSLPIAVFRWYSDTGIALTWSVSAVFLFVIPKGCLLDSSRMNMEIKESENFLMCDFFLISCNIFCKHAYSCKTDISHPQFIDQLKSSYVRLPNYDLNVSRKS